MTNLLDPLNMNKICRTCLTVGEMQSIYSSYYTVLDIIKSCMPIQLAEHELFPTQICIKCISEIDRINKFKQLCETTENTLNDYVQQMQVVQIKNETEDYIKDQINLPKDNSQINIKHESDNEHIEDFDSASINSETTLELRLQKEQNKHVNVDKKHLKRNKRLKYECKMCNIMFSTKKELLGHRKNTKHINKRLYTCTICSENIPGGSVKTHMKLHTSEKLHDCHSCGRNFYSTYNLKRHMLTHTGARPFQCELCNKSFTRLTYLNDHCKLHCGETSNVCSFCGKTFAEDVKFNLHLKMHDTTDNKCDTCDEPFANADLLLQHLKSHEVDGTLLCKVCGKRFARIRPFKIHMKKHADKTGEKDEDKSYTHVCKYCQRGFQTKASLNNHLLTHGEKSFLCSDCGKGFVSLAQLQTHMRSHTGLKPYKCKQCDKSFAQRSGLNTHVLIHTGVKPYICTVCDKSFTQSHHRKRHMLIHTGERPYKCTICDKSFAQKENYTVHVRVHTGETPYTCSVCNKGFYDSSSLNKHKKSHNK